MKIYRETLRTKAKYDLVNSSFVQHRANTVFLVSCFNFDIFLLFLKFFALEYSVLAAEGIVLNNIESKRLIGNLSKGFSNLTNRTRKKSLLLDKVGLRDFDGHVAPNGKPYRLYNKNETYAVLGLKKNSSKLNSLVSELGIDPEYGNAWRINIDERIKLQRALGEFPKFKRTKLQTGIAILFANLKGGCGKTTAATIVATGLACDASKEYKICFLDLDPQRTATLRLNNNLPEEYISAGDLLMAEQNLEIPEGVAFKDVVLSACLPTNFKNLDVLPAGKNDFQYVVYSDKKKRIANENKQRYSSGDDLKRIMDALKEEYDIIIVDTQPAVSDTMFAAHSTVDKIIIPLQCTDNDKEATDNYLESLNDHYDVLYNSHKGYGSVHLLISSFKSDSSSQLRIRDELKTEFGSYILDELKHSEAILNTAEEQKNIYDLSPCQYDGSPRTLATAQDYCRTMIRTIEGQLKAQWEDQTETNSTSYEAVS